MGGKEGKKKVRPPSSASPTGAPRRHGARAEVGGERGPGARPDPRPSSPGKRDGARERRARPGEAPEPSGRESVVPPSSHTPPPPRESTSSSDGTGSCRGTRARPAIARGRRRRRRRPRRLPPCAPYPPPAAWPRPGWGERDGVRNGAGGRTNGRRRRGAEALPRRSGRKNGGARRRETGRDLGRPPADLGYHRRPPSPERARERPPRVHPKKSPRRGPRRARGSPTLRVVREEKGKKTNPCVEG